MSEAPERIWAKVHGASTDVISGKRGLLGGWNEHARDGQTEYVRADRIEALERDNAALRDNDAKMQLLHQQEDQLIAAERKVAELEADKARLSEALRGIADAIRNGLTENGLPDHRIKIGEGCRIEDGFLVGPGADTIRDMLTLMRDLSDAALSGSGSGWRVPDGWKLVPVEPTDEMLRAGQIAADDHHWKWCGYGPRKDGEGLDGMLFHVREAYRAMLHAAPQQGGE